MAKRISISSVDEEWLDNDANLVVEQQCPTINQFLQVAQLINRFLDVSSNPNARQLEMVLALFCHDIHVDQARSPRETSILDYFAKAYTYYIIGRLKYKSSIFLSEIAETSVGHSLQ